MPPSEDKRPPANAAARFWRQTAGNANGMVVVWVMKVRPDKRAE